VLRVALGVSGLVANTELRTRRADDEHVDGVKALVQKAEQVVHWVVEAATDPARPESLRLGMEVQGLPYPTRLPEQQVVAARRFGDGRVL
jgi:hypothetical protein